jgi:hypothetical protein
MRKYFVEPDRVQMRILHMRMARWIPKAKTHTLRICNTYCFFTATMVAQTLLYVTLYKHSLSCYLFVAARRQSEF